MPILDFSRSVSYPRTVQGIPFSAQFEASVLQETVDGETREQKVSGKICRDNAGRRREDFRMQLGRTEKATVDMTVILDPLRQMSYLLDHARQTVILQEVITDDDVDPWPWNPETFAFSNDGPTAQKAQIEGFVCYRILRRAPDRTVEFLFSPDLQEVLYEKVTSGSREKEFRIFHVRLSEPESDLFTPPRSYSQLS